MSMLFVVLFFESIIFPTIVALGMRGLGRYSKRGSGFIIAGVAGGAVVPPLLFVAADSRGAVNVEAGYAPTAFAMVVPLMFFLGPLSYAVAVNFDPKYRKIADRFHETEVGIVDRHAKDAENQGGVMGGDTKEGAVLGDENTKDRTVQMETVDGGKKV
jgi:FHS family L-fucose permease-like MFS transporter